MNNTSFRAMLLLILLFLLPFATLAGCSFINLAGDVTTVIESQTQPTYEIATVTRVVDGDTIKVDVDGIEYTVRYIGIDTPETVHPQKPVEFMGKEASAKNKELVEGKTILLEKDVSETDRYGRLLRYIWVKLEGMPIGDSELSLQWSKTTAYTRTIDGDLYLMANAELVALGYAQVVTYPPDVKYQPTFLELQRQAKEQKLGLWAE